MKEFIADSHNDFMTNIKTSNQRKKYIVQCVKNGVKVLGCAIFTTECSYSIEDITHFKTELDDLSAENGVNLLLTIEDLGFINSMCKLQQLIDLKPFSATLTWNYLNQYAGGANTDFGLTSLGKRVVQILESNNILVDTAHLSRRAFDEFVQITTLPIYNSHCNVNNLYSHNRNLTSNQIQQIVDSCGYMGVTFYNKFISNNIISSLDIALQFDYLINKFGSNNFGVGSDFYGFDTKYSPVDVKGYQHFNKLGSSVLKTVGDCGVVSKIMGLNFFDFVKRIGGRNKV